MPLCGDVRACGYCWAPHNSMHLAIKTGQCTGLQCFSQEAPLCLSLSYSLQQQERNIGDGMGKAQNTGDSPNRSTAHHPRNKDGTTRSERPRLRPFISAQGLQQMQNLQLLFKLVTRVKLARSFPAHFQEFMLLKLHRKSGGRRVCN